MADAALHLVLQELGSLFFKEGCLFKGMDEEIYIIRSELMSIQSFLKYADEAEESYETTDWVKQVRELAYEIEDVVDEFQIKQSRLPYFYWLPMICYLPTALKSRGRLASAIERIRSRTYRISAACYGEHKLEDAKEQDSGTTIKPNESIYQDLRETELAGIKRPKKELLDLIIEDEWSKLKVISVVGMGGLGKTTLTKLVYDDMKVKKNFKIRAWIHVSQSFRVDRLLQNLVTEIFYESGDKVPEGMENMSILQLSSTIKNFLQKRRFFIVLDDVWSPHLWNTLKPILPDDESGCRVLLTTRSRDVASAFRTEAEEIVYQMQPLSPLDSMKLFCRGTMQSNEFSYDVLKRCGGLPHAIVAIRCAMAKQSKQMLQEQEIIKLLFDPLQSSYRDLPYHLKSCLQYLSVFPSRYSISHKRLIRLWIAEGFIQQEEGRGQEEVAEDYLRQLVSRSFIDVTQASTDGRPKTYKINNVVHEFIKYKSRQQNFEEILDVPKIASLDKIRRLSLHNPSESSRAIHFKSKLRSLLMFWGVNFSAKPATFELPSGSYMLLTVLDLCGAPLDKFPDKVTKMVLLKYLSLRNTNVNFIPKSIGKLQHLQTLDLKHSLVTNLPTQILKLEKLRHLLVGLHDIPSETSRFSCPVALERFQSLQTLCFIEAGHDIIKGLSKLIRLRRLGIVKLWKKDGKFLCESIERLENLRSLCITSAREDEMIDMESISTPPPFLQRLYLSGRLEKLPKWVNMLHSLAKLQLRWSRLRDDPLEILKDLPNLKHLEFIKVYEGEKLSFKGGFLKLKFLSIDDMSELQHIVVMKGALPCLEELIIQSCKSLESLPSDIEYLPKLKELTYSGDSVKFVASFNPTVHKFKFNCPKLDREDVLFAGSSHEQPGESSSIKECSSTPAYCVN